MRRLLLTVTAALALVGALIAGAAADTFQVGNLKADIDGKITPSKLPRHGQAPIGLEVSGSIDSVDGSHPAALKSIHLEFDKNGSLNTKGLPTCAPAKLFSTLTSQAKKACGSAQVGSGKVTAEIALPEQAPFSASGPLLIFNGPPKGGKQVLVFHVYAHVPAPTTFVTTAVISKQGGKYGTVADIKIPTIVSGQGSLTAFKATLKKTWTYRGKKQSLLLAGCPSGKLQARGEFLFADGTKGSGEVVRPCTPTG
jgi:hypothetical protein